MGLNQKNKKQDPRIIRIWLVIMSIFIGELFLYTWCRVQFVRTGYEITRASDDQQQQLKIQQNLVIELARLKSPERIEKIARQELGLIIPAPDQIMVIP